MWAELQFLATVCFCYSVQTQLGKLTEPPWLWNFYGWGSFDLFSRLKVCFNWILSRAYECEYWWTNGKISVARKRRLWIGRMVTEMVDHQDKPDDQTKDNNY